VIPRSVRTVLLTALALVVTLLPGTAAARQVEEPARTPTITSGDGIAVLSTTPFDDRTIDVRISTPLVSDGATIKGNGLRIVLPEGYDPRSSRRYPVLYLLHGGASSHTTWYASNAADIVRFAGSDLIIVMPDGGKIGMYTDWVDQTAYRQSWLTFHLTQLIPFVDRNLKTIADRESRAIAGVSMGGGGAFHYAFARPDLFGVAASFSGVLNPHSPLGVAGIAAVNSYWKMPTFGQYGLPFWPFWEPWRAANPVAHAAKFRGVTTLLYAGEGTDPVELTMRDFTETMSRALTKAGVPHTYVNYGRPGGRCNGGHEIGCGAHAFALAMPEIREALSLPALDRLGPAS
jgi:S-formylglutathione hydrolase FrmB